MEARYNQPTWLKLYCGMFPEPKSPDGILLLYIPVSCYSSAQVAEKHYWHIMSVDQKSSQYLGSMTSTSAIS